MVSAESAVARSDHHEELPDAVAAAAQAAANEGPLDRQTRLSEAPREGLPIFEPGEPAVAFYEVDLSPGWAIVTTSAPARVIELGAAGEGPATQLMRAAKGSLDRIFRLDTALYVAVDDAGRAVAQTSAISRIDRSGARASLVPVSAEDAIAAYPTARSELLRRFAANGVDVDPQTWTTKSTDPRACEAEGDVPSFRQIPPWKSPNDTACHSGCGATAWAIIFGWASRRAAATPSDAAFAGLFRDGNDATGATVVAPMVIDPISSEVTWTVRQSIGTVCLGDQGATPPWNMDDVASFVSARAPRVTVHVRSSYLMLASGGIKSDVIDALCEGRPSILGTGSLFAGNGHYPIATAYERGLVRLEMGWGGSSNGWYDTGTWFLGNVTHY